MQPLPDESVPLTSKNSPKEQSNTTASTADNKKQQQNDVANHNSDHLNNNTPNNNDHSLTKREISWLTNDSPSRARREKSEEADRTTIDNESGNGFLAEIEGLHAQVGQGGDRHPMLQAIRAMLEHRWCHYCVIALVVFDVFLVVSSLLVEIRAVEMKCQEHLRRARESEASSLASMRAVCNRTSGQSAINALAMLNNDTSVDEAINATARVQELLIVMLGAFDVQQLRSLEVVEETLHFTGLAIICIFVVEVTLKVIAFCPEFFRSKIDVLDMLLVYISFVCELALSVSDVRIGVREAVFVAMLLRLWRIARIVSGVVISMKTKYEGEIVRLKTKLKAAQSGSRNSLCTIQYPRASFFKTRHMSEANFSIVREKFQPGSALAHQSELRDEDEEEPETPALQFQSKRKGSNTTN